ncbi:phosphatase PAP2 family protein [Haloarchaeobius sp. DFWS5]|uniref:phosphatase PAP2 family protein n=1 Tax=Haloarchaeobius sp. DFWS5 TaxID=3446114 RepID=UPI003EC13381
MERPEGGSTGRRTGRLLVAVALVLGLVLTFVLQTLAVDRSLGLSVPQIRLAVQILAGVLTQAGDPWFLVIVVSAVYLAGPTKSLVRTPKSGAFAVATTYGAFATIDLLKHVYRAPRPGGAGSVTIPEWVPPTVAGPVANLVTGTGYAFPSGHALGTTVVFGALASVLTVGTARARWLAAAAGVVLVAATRLVLGVHFLADVLVGIVVGVGFLGVAIWLDDPKRVFGLGAVVAAIAAVFAITGPEGTAWTVVQWLGASVGGGLAWHFARPAGGVSLRTALVVGLPAGFLWAVVYLFSPSIPVILLFGTVFGGWTIAAPRAVAQYQQSSLEPGSTAR